MHSSEIDNLLSGADRVDLLAQSVREFFLENNAGRSHADRVSYSVSPHDPTGFIAHVLHAKIIARFEYARYVGSDFKLITGQYVFTRKVGDNEVQLPIRLRLAAPNHLILPGGQVCNLNPADSIGQYGNMVWNGLTYVLLGEVLKTSEEWTPPARS